MVAQFVLLLWAAELWDEGLFAPAGRHRWIAAMLVLGAAATFYDVFMFRFYPVLSDNSTLRMYRWLSPDRSLGKRTYALRQLYEELRVKLPERAIVQHNPRANPGDLFYGLYADRQAAAETSACGVVFGGDPARCPGMIAALDTLFEKPGLLDPNAVDAICGKLSISALVVKDSDKVWADPNSWVWKKEPVLANQYGRAYLCTPSH